MHDSTLLMHCAWINTETEAKQEPQTFESTYSVYYKIKGGYAMSHFPN